MRSRCCAEERYNFWGEESEEGVVMGRGKGDTTLFARCAIALCVIPKS